jgi:hypothetical protein
MVYMRMEGIMEALQRLVMLLKPDAHVPGRWDSGATLRINAVPGGAALSLKSDTRDCEGGTLTLFMKDGAPLAAGEVRSAGLEARLGGLRLENIAGAAVIRDNRFVLNSAGPDWAAIIARDRFAGASRGAAAEAAEEAAPAEEAALQEAVDESREANRDETPAPKEMSRTLPAPTDTPEVFAEAPPDTAPEDSCPRGIRETAVDPFPGTFPGSEWTKISYPGPAGWWHYILGRVFIDGRETDVIGVPGEYGMTPPAWLEGFSTWMRCASTDARGYWLMFQDVQTGRVLDTGRSRRGG